MIRYTDEPLPKELENMEIIGLQHEIRNNQDTIKANQKRIQTIQASCDHVFCFSLIGGRRCDVCRKCGKVDE